MSAPRTSSCKRSRMRSAHRGMSIKAREEYSIEVAPPCISAVALARCLRTQQDERIMVRCPGWARGHSRCGMAASQGAAPHCGIRRRRLCLWDSARGALVAHHRGRPGTTTVGACRTNTSLGRAGGETRGPVAAAFWQHERTQRTGA